MIDHRRYLLVIIGLLSIGIFSAFYTPKHIQVNKDFENLEIKIDGWHFLEDIKLDQKTYDALDPKSFIFRNYRNNKGDVLNLIVVYHKNDRWGAHNPIVCYKSQGWDVIEGLRSLTIRINNQDFPINRFVVKKGGVKNLVYYYWFSSNKKMTANRNKQMFDMVLNGLIHGYTESGFVEMSMHINSLIEEDRKVEELNDFTAKFTLLLEKIL